MSNEKNEPMRAKEVVELLKNKFGDSMATLRIRSLRETDTVETVNQRVQETLKEMHEMPEIKEVLPDRPEIHTYKKQEHIEVKPGNETAKRLIQMLNCQLPQV